MASAKDWLEGARLRTLPAAAAPVFMGAGAAAHLHGFSWGKSLLALVVALFLQIGVNFSNDYSDGIRGTDQHRVGPLRLTASGAVPPKTVLGVALGCFATAGVAGVALVAWSGMWWLLAVGVGAVVAAWFYTGGKNPYGYSGVGASEALVFIFFGLFATVGTTVVQTHSAPWWLWVAASGIGIASVSLLMVNNLRDIPTDTVAGKRTVAVRLGDRASRATYVILLVISAGLSAVAAAGTGASWPWTLAVGGVLALAAAPGAVQVLSGARGSALLSTLRNTGLYTLAYGVVLSAVFTLGAPDAL